MNQSIINMKQSVALLVLLAITLTGCQPAAQVTTSLTDQYAGNDLDSQMNFWHSLNDKKLLCNNDAFHGVILFYCQKDITQNYEDRVSRLKADGLLPQNFSETANQAITRGRLASILAKMLKVKGGIMMRLLGPNPRYALKELIALNIFTPSSPGQVLNGAQFIDIIGRAEDYMLNTNRKATADQINLTDQTPQTQKATPQKNNPSQTSDSQIQ